MIAIFDIGKTNKKCFVMDEAYRIVFEKTSALAETTDEDGDPCEDLGLLNNWVLESVREVLGAPRFQIRAINCTAYGASFVHLNAKGQPLTPLYNYLKPYPEDLRKQFFEAYGGEEKMALETASPVLGMLNSGLQLYWLKHQKPMVFKQIKWSLHLPQHVSRLISQFLNSPGDSKSPGEFRNCEITSIGCHTMLWDFRKNDYHDWVKAEGIAEKFPPIQASNWVVQIHKSPPPSSRLLRVKNPPINIGTGLHDSSAALVPYLTAFQKPFVLISTGTWCISLNPFNNLPLTADELAQGCLCYISPEARHVKAARYFGGQEHDQAVQRIAAEYGVAADFYKKASLAPRSIAESAYLEFMHQLVGKQVASTRLVLSGPLLYHIFVDGGFAKNEIYMTLLARAFPHTEVFAAEVAQAAALGAALPLHRYWNSKPVPDKLISLKKY